MCVIKGNHITVRIIHIYVPHVDLHIGRKEVLPMLVNRPLNDLIHGADSEGVFSAIETNIGDVPPGGTNINGFPFAGDW